MGTSVLYIAELKAKPVAMTTYYETNKKPCIPVIVVACENTIYYFKDFTPTTNSSCRMLNSAVKSKKFGKIYKKQTMIC